MNSSKKVDISRVSPSIPLRLSNKVLVILKYHKDKGKNLVKQVNTQNDWSYVQEYLVNVKDIVKIKEIFLNLSTKKIKEIQKVINEQKKKKPRFNITIKDSLKKQVLVPMSSTNSNKFMAMSSIHITNINRAPKGIKSNIMANFV